MMRPTLVRVVASLVALYDIFAITLLGPLNVLLGAGIVGAVAALALVWGSERLTVQIAGFALAGGILAVLLGLAPAMVGALMIMAYVPLVIVENHAERSPSAGTNNRDV